jgi:hypothetical protein
MQIHINLEQRTHVQQFCNADPEDLLRSPTYYYAHQPITAITCASAATCVEKQSYKQSYKQSCRV